MRLPYAYRLSLMEKEYGFAHYSFDLYNKLINNESVHYNMINYCRNPWYTDSDDYHL